MPCSDGCFRFQIPPKKWRKIYFGSGGGGWIFWDFFGVISNVFPPSFHYVPIKFPKCSPTYSQQHLTLSHMICPIVSLGMHIGGLGTYMFGVNVSICCWRVSKVLELFLSWANQKGSLHKKRFIG